MARPKVLPNHKNAYERLSDAFWTTLEDYPLEQISVTSIPMPIYASFDASRVFSEYTRIRERNGSSFMSLFQLP